MLNFAYSRASAAVLLERAQVVLRRVRTTNDSLQGATAHSYRGSPASCSQHGKQDTFESASRRRRRSQHVPAPSKSHTCDTAPPFASTFSPILSPIIDSVYLNFSFARKQEGARTMRAIPGAAPSQSGSERASEADSVLSLQPRQSPRTRASSSATISPRLTRWAIVRSHSPVVLMI